MDRPPPVAPGEGGASTERLMALSDGVFAIAMTLLVLDLAVPDGLDSEGFHEALRASMPNLAAYVLSFVVIADFWSDHRRILGSAEQGDGRVTALTLFGLCLIALLPFPTALLAEYAEQPVAVAVYAGNVSLTNAAHVALLHLLHGRRRRAAGPDAARAHRLEVADLGSTVLVFGLSVPLAFVTPDAALYSWLLLIPLRAVIGRRQRHLARASSAVPYEAPRG